MTTDNQDSYTPTALQYKVLNLMNGLISKLGSNFTSLKENFRLFQDDVFKEALKGHFSQSEMAELEGDNTETQMTKLQATISESAMAEFLASKTESEIAELSEPFKPYNETHVDLQNEYSSTTFPALYAASKAFCYLERVEYANGDISNTATPNYISLSNKSDFLTYMFNECSKMYKLPSLFDAEIAQFVEETLQAAGEFNTEL